MKNYKQILEAINRGIQLALDDYEDDGELTSKSNVVKNLDNKKLWNFYNSFVDLGLPSGTMWCKYNLGCNWDKLNIDPEHTKPEDWYGNYYAWGEIEPKKEYSYKTYKFSIKEHEDFTCFKYNCNNLSRYYDKLRILEPEDDAAYNDLKYLGKFRIPTYEDLLELKQYTDKEYINNYLNIRNLDGLEFTSKINGNKIFLPAAGMFQNKKYTSDKCGNYWTSSCLNKWYELPAYKEFFNSTGDFTNEKDLQNSKVNGLSIRPILNKN